MSEADKMFDNLGYNKYEFDTYIDYLSRECRKGITFRKDMQVIDCHCGIGSEYITMQELQATNMKVSELRMDVKPANIPVTKGGS